MKRTGLLTLLALLIALPLGAIAQDEVTVYTIGMVTYQIDGRVPPSMDLFVGPLTSDLVVLPLPENSQGGQVVPATGNQFVLNLIEAASANEQIQAIDQLLAAGADALVITPAPEANLIKDAVARAAAQMPVALAHRPIPGLDLPFYGQDTAQVGTVWKDGSQPFAILGNLSDPLQKGLIDAMRDAEAFLGFYEALDGQAEAAKAIADHADLFGIIVTNPAYASGAAEAIRAATEGTDRLIKLGSLGAPENYKDLFDAKQLNAVIAWNNYGILLDAAVAMKVKLLGDEPTSAFADIIFMTSATSWVSNSYPYLSPSHIGRFWR